MFQIVAERLQIVVGREILLRTPPGRDRVHDPADQLLDAALAPGRPQLSPEILRDDDVGRLLRPRLRDLHVALLEDDLATLVADDSGTQLPLDFVERIDVALGEKARERQPGRRRHRVPGAGAIEIDVGEPTRGTFLDCLRAKARSLVSSALLHGSLRKKTRSPPQESRPSRFNG